MIKDLLKTFKINHYIKNIIVIIPLIFSMSFTNGELWIKCLAIFFAFCFISSAVYVLNDLIDVEKDRQHPIKCKRPIASGRIPLPVAILSMLILLTFSCLIGFKLNLLCLITILCYFILNIFYSLWLKNIALIDVACIAIGFVLRVVAGCFAITVIPSALVILLTFFASMFFTFTKRKLELQLNGNNCRPSIKDFNIDVANQFILINAILSIAFYFTYMLDETTIQKAGTPYLYITAIPFTLIVFRLLLLNNISTNNDDPIHFIENDKPLKWLFIGYLLILFLIIN